MMSELKPCPCGQTPSELEITDAGQGSKWANVSGDCCGEWEIEFRTNYTDLDSKVCKALAVKAWNEAPRQPSGDEKELLQLIHDDLKIRADIEGVVNISDFIWQRLVKTLNTED